MKQRIRFLGILFGIWTFLIIGRIIYWQVWEANTLKKTALSQYGQTINIPADRGQIFASDNFPLAQNTASYLLFAEPKKVQLTLGDKQLLENLISATDSTKIALDQISTTNLSWVPIAHYISPEIKSAIEQLKISGLGFETEPLRLYPEGSSSAHITGFVGKNLSGSAQGYFGLEGFYNRILSGKPGRLIQESDARNRPIVIGDQNIIASQPGQNLITSIDRTVQYIAYTKLAEGLVKYKAKSGTVSIMESQTGQILAMVSLPGYDPANYWKYDSSLYKNPIVSDGYEPGSTFKVLIMGAALDAQVINPKTICTECNGPKVISGYQVSSYNDRYYPESTMSDIILHSDNIGMVFVGKKLGKKYLLEYLKKFGIGQLTGIDLEEENAPALRSDNDWHDIDLATVTFGQGVSVTRIQMLTAVNALANGGRLIPPQIVTKVQSDQIIKPLPRRQPTQAISAKAAAEVVAMMKNGVENGEVRYYRVPGYTVAGKTGTAQVPIEGHYDKEKLISSFIAFAPVENPKFTMLITLREPQTSPWGSTTAAPLWFSIAKELFRYYKIPPH